MNVDFWTKVYKSKLERKIEMSSLFKPLEFVQFILYNFYLPLFSISILTNQAVMTR